MGLFKNKKGKPSKFAGILKGVLQSQAIRAIVPGGNLISNAVGVLVPDKSPETPPDAVKQISNPILKDIVQAIVILGPIIYGIIELFKS